jgi:hypothetical protein
MAIYKRVAAQCKCAAAANLPKSNPANVNSMGMFIPSLPKGQTTDRFENMEQVNRQYQK